MLTKPLPVPICVCNTQSGNHMINSYSSSLKLSVLTFFCLPKSLKLYIHENYQWKELRKLAIWRKKAKKVWGQNSKDDIILNSTPRTSTATLLFETISTHNHLHAFTTPITKPSQDFLTAGTHMCHFKCYPLGLGVSQKKRQEFYVPKIQFQF